MYVLNVVDVICLLRNASGTANISLNPGPVSLCFGLHFLCDGVKEVSYTCSSLFNVKFKLDKFDVVLHISSDFTLFDF